MGKEAIVVDTNLLISALGWKGKPRMLLNLVLEDKLKLLLSSKQLKELIRVLGYPKFAFTQAQRDKFLTILLKVAVLVEIKTELDIIKEDPPDNMMIECAIENNAKFIITGNKHLLKIKEYYGIRIMTVSEFLKLVEK